MEPHPFERTLRSLEGDGYGKTLAWTAVVLVLFALWGSWLLLARVPVYVTSAGARLEVAEDAYRIEAAAAGELREVRVQVGDAVAAGQELFAVAAEVERRRLGEEMARQQGVAEQLAAARLELESRRRELAERRTAGAAALAEAEADLQAARAAAELAEADARRSERLAESGLIAPSEGERLRSLAAQRRHQAAAAERAVEQARAAAAAGEGDLDAGVAQGRQQIASLEAQAQVGTEVLARLAEEVEQRSIRAPAAGRVAELAVRRVGAQVEVGEHLATIVPDAGLRVVASFSPAVALGRVEPGQQAEVRLDGFPWTEHGSLDARVARVSAEPREGTVRVELSLQRSPTSSLPLRHGLPAEVLVRIDETSPLSLVLRSVGHRLDGVANQNRTTPAPNTGAAGERR